MFVRYKLGFKKKKSLWKRNHVEKLKGRSITTLLDLRPTWKWVLALIYCRVNKLSFPPPLTQTQPIYIHRTKFFKNINFHFLTKKSKNLLTNVNYSYFSNWLDKSAHPGGESPFEETIWRSDSSREPCSQEVGRCSKLKTKKSDLIKRPEGFPSVTTFLSVH